MYQANLILSERLESKHKNAYTLYLFSDTTEAFKVAFIIFISCFSVLVNTVNSDMNVNLNFSRELSDFPKAMMYEALRYFHIISLSYSTSKY